MHAVEIQGLSKYYDLGSFVKKRRRALDRLELVVEPNEIFGLIGPNGAGKTTTLKLLMGIVYPTEGDARILGRPLHDPEMKRRIGYLPEQPYFYDYLTGRELLLYFGQLFGLSKRERNDHTRELLEKVRMTEAADLPLRKYSKGMTQRIGIAQALVNRPTLVFLDEPMSGLDPVGRREMTQLIRELRDSGVTVFFCSHILPDVEQLCDRVAILNRGKLLEVGRLTDILNVSIQTVEVVAENLSAQVERDIVPKVLEIRRVGDRCHIGFRAAEDFDRAVPFLIQGGARLVSVNRVRETLEEHFVREVEAGGERER
jgi:ABC-2 type transport system ATP-binding protein